MISASHNPYYDNGIKFFSAQGHHRTTHWKLKSKPGLTRRLFAWLLAVASHGGTFHAPQEFQRILGHGLDNAMQARIATTKVLASLGFTGDVPLPDISAKSKAQAYIGLDIAS